VIKLGASSRYNNETESRIYKIKKLFIHPDYNTYTFSNDIGLIKLKDSVTFSQFISPICLPFNYTTPDKITSIIFGRINSQTEEMLKVGLEKFYNLECQSNLGEYPKINYKMQCYGHKNKNYSNYEVRIKMNVMCLM